MFIKDRKILFENFPNFICPKCNTGILRIDNESIKKRRPSHIAKLPDYGDILIDKDGKEYKETDILDILETEYDEYLINMFIKCDNNNCNEVFTSCGKSKYEQEVKLDENGELYDVNILYFFPKIFFPTIRLFEVPINTDDVIINELDISFNLFWVDLSSCANSLRKTVERIVGCIDDRPNNTTLHKRINRLNEEYSEIKGILKAIKWIGNDGSHQSDLELNDVIIAFELIERVLNVIFIKDDYKEIVDRINKTKKPLSKQ